MIIEGNFILPKRGEVFTQVEVDDVTHLIARVGDELGKVDRRFSPAQLIFPGMVDIHIHAREDETGKENYKETYQTANDAALNGGVVAVAAMPNTPAPLLTEQQLAWHVARHHDLPTAFVNYAGVGPGTRPLGCKIPYKVYTGPSVGPLFFRDEHELRATLKNYSGQAVSFHVEDFAVLEANKEKPTHSERRPRECVETALQYVLQLIEEFDLRAKLCHWPVGGKSFAMIATHRARGFKTTLEVSPLHLFFDAEMLQEKPELWPYVQMNPALQSKADRLELIAALKGGFIQYLATDHAPHTLDEKFKHFGGEESYLTLRAENLSECRRLACCNGVSGTPQLDTYALVVSWLMHEQGFSASRIAEVTAEAPGEFINPYLPHEYGNGFGKITPGYMAAFTVLDLRVPFRLTRKVLRSKVAWSPFEGVEFPGKVVGVFTKGKWQ